MRSLGITITLDPNRTPRVLAGVPDCTVPCEPLGETPRVADPRRREIYHVRDDHNAGLLARWRVGESWFMDRTRMFERRLDGNHFRLVFVELRTWLVRIRFFPCRSSRRLVERTE